MKRIIHILLILMTVISLSSCIEARREFTDHGEIYEDREWDLFPEGHLVDEPITISYWSANSAVDHQGTTQAQLVDQFNAMQRENYPDSPIKVVASFQGGYNTQNQKLQAALMGNNNPEIAMIGISSLALYLDYAVDMREIFTYDEIRNIYEGFLQFAMYQQKFVGYPYFAATNAFIVNKTRWNQTGLPFPSIETIVNNPEESIWTWEALKAAAEAMTVVESDETKYGLAVNGIPIYESLFTQGVAPYDPIATKAIFNNEAGLKAFTYWQNMAKNGYMGNPAEDPNHNTKIQAAFSSGDVGMLFASSSGFKVISEQVGDDFELDVLPFPKVSNFYSNQSGGGLVIFNNKSKARQKAAVEFLRWLQAASRLSKEIREQRFEKKYLAIVEGELKSEEEITLRDFLRKDKKHKKALITNPKLGKESILKFKKLAQIDNLSLLKVKLVTGRFHQIRAQLANYGTPIYGDSKYGTSKKNFNLALYAHWIKFKHPTKEEKIVIKHFPNDELFLPFLKAAKLK